MHAIELAGPDLAQLRRVEQPDPAQPGPGRVLVRMKAASLNFIDIAIASGQYPGVTFPIVPLVDGAGEVMRIGPEVWEVDVGDRVAVNGKPRWIAGSGSAPLSKPTRGLNLRGSVVEIAELDAASVVKAPDHLGWEEIAAIPGAGSAAWKALEAASIGPASTVVLLGTGGVSIFALQLAKTRGARVVITSSSDEKLLRARTLGADETINYRQRPDWDAAVLSLTGGAGADLVIDSAGGTEFGRSLQALRYGGMVYALGFVGGTTTELSLLALNSNGLRIQGTNGASVAEMAATMAVFAVHGLRPIVDRSFPLTELAEAYRFAKGGSHVGKIGVTLEW